MAAPLSRGLTWADLERTPDDGNTYELIDGELVVTSPHERHTWAGFVIVGRLYAYYQQHRGRGSGGDLGLLLSESDILIPDATFTRTERVGEVFGIDPRGLAGVPDLVVEVSSPSTRRRDLGVKRDLYERHGVAEYWFVDRDAECVLVHLLLGGGYGKPQRVGRGEVLQATALPGFALDVDELFDDPRG